MDETKLIVTHRGALEAKYGKAAARVDKALSVLVAADAKRGIGSRVVALDSRGDMAAFRTRPMGGPQDREGAKRCIDAIDAAMKPHYFVIVGGPDVVPMQLLGNPAGMIMLRTPDNGDPDFHVPSDLPYACDAGFSDDAGDFQGPTRVVGRLPDIPNARSPAYLVRVIELAAQAKPLARSDYRDWLALSAQVWEESTAKTLKGLFGDATRMVLSPPKRDGWFPRDLAPRVHFINCHGGERDVVFTGQRRKLDGTGGAQVDALSTPSLKDKVTPGTVVVAECCYGAQVFSPRREDQAKQPGKLGIALEYLRQGAYGFFGATTIAYGPSDRNDWADVICRIFMEKVLAGASLGRAALEARAGYVKFDKWTDPLKLKTLAQFYLLGDPSIHPVAPDASRPARREREIRVDPEVERRQRERRRSRQRRESAAWKGARKLLREELAQVPDEIEQEIRARAEALGMKSKLVTALSLLAASKAAAQGDTSATTRRRNHRVIVLIGLVEKEMEDREAGGKNQFPQYGVVIAQVRGGKIVSLKHGVSR